MADPNNIDPDSKAPGEVRSNIQVVVRVLLAIVIVALVGGTIWALVSRAV